MKPALTALERVAIVLASLALSIGLIALLSGFFAGRDQAGVSGQANPPGQAFADLGHARLQPGDRRPAYNSDPPTSGAHVPAAVSRDQTGLSDDQLLQALQLGDVAIAYGSSVAPPQLVALARQVASPFTPSLAAAGQAVILDRRPGTVGYVALAWAHLLRVDRPDDPQLRQFATFWLGRGAQGR